MESFFPLARKQVVVQPVDQELIVYDTRDAQANLLNRTAAVVYGLCDGKTNVTALAQKASAQLGAPVDEALVWYALEQLSKKNMLQERAATPMGIARMSRRDFLRAGMAGAAVAIPVVVTMTAPQATQAASCLQSGVSCAFGTDCCSSVCTSGSCA